MHIQQNDVHLRTGLRRQTLPIFVSVLQMLFDLDVGNGSEFILTLDVLLLLSSLKRMSWIHSFLLCWRVYLPAFLSWLYHQFLVVVVVVGETVCVFAHVHPLPHTHRAPMFSKLVNSSRDAYLLLLNRMQSIIKHLYWNMICQKWPLLFLHCKIKMTTLFLKERVTQHEYTAQLYNLYLPLGNVAWWLMCLTRLQDQDSPGPVTGKLPLPTQHMGTLVI